MPEKTVSQEKLLNLRFNKLEDSETEFESFHETREYR